MPQTKYSLLMDISSIKLYATHEHPCSYLDGQSARTAFVDPAITIDATIYSELANYGFRRSGEHVYRPHCNDCQACTPIRIPVEHFKPSRAQKRCLKRNIDIEVIAVDDISSDEHYNLYERYINLRHADGDMYPPSHEQYTSFLTSVWGITQFLEFRKEGKLLGVAVTDKLDYGLSAIYTYFEPEETSRSLGVFGVLHQIELTRKSQLPYLYLGYWIRDCQKMSYKTQYKPLQMLINNQWITLEGR